MFKRIYVALAPYSKAIIGFIAPLIVGFGLKYGFNVDVAEVNVILTAIITAVGVFAKANVPDPEGKAL